MSASSKAFKSNVSLEMRSRRIFEYFLFNAKTEASHIAANGMATRDKYLGWNSFSETNIMPDPMSSAMRTTVPLRKGLKMERRDVGISPIKISRAGLLMVVRKIMVDIRAYMAEKMSNLNKKARNAKI